MRFTIFTPTYNRAYRIEALYQSLKRQTFRDFEWIVVDDGSTDNTQELFSVFLREDNDFSIIYKKTENGGKHRAINRGVSLARGELFFIVDSDDYLPDDSLERIDRVEKTIPIKQKKDFGGVCGIKGYSLSEFVGKTFDGQLLDITTLEREKNGIFGDKAEVFYTDVMRRYPFPEFDGENFLTECVVWDRIAYDNYKLRFFNDIVYVCEYLADGLSAHSDECFDKSPKGYGLYLSQSVKFKRFQGMNKWIQYFKYYNQFRSRFSMREIAKNLDYKPFCFCLRIIGLKIFYKLYDNDWK